jgi:hypothetical protein
MFTDGIPANDTIARKISVIDPDSFNKCFITWIKSVHQLTNGDVMRLMGNAMRSYNRDDRNSTIHMISAYASANKRVLGQLKTQQ